MLFIYHRDYGYATARAYVAYQDPDFLDLAVTAWTTAKQATISEEQAVTGTVDGKQFNLSLSCQGGEWYPWPRLIHDLISVDSNSGRRHLLGES